MAFAKHVRVTALGRLGTPEAERFSYGFCLAPDDGIVETQDWLDTNVSDWDDLTDSVRDFHGRAASKIANQRVLEAVKIAHIGTDGKYTSDPYIKVYNQAGTGGAGAIVPQEALAISLLTERRGQSGRGRFFIPCPYVAVDSTDYFRMSVATAEGIRDSAKTLLDDVNNWPGVDALRDTWKVVIASTKGFNTKVSGVKVGRVVDTIRSRRTSLPESYVATVGVS